MARNILLRLPSPCLLEQPDFSTIGHSPFDLMRLGCERINSNSPALVSGDESGY